MNAAIVSDLQYPIGNFIKKDHYPEEEIQEMITVIAGSPAKYHSLVTTLSETDLLKTYREGGWNIRQLVHHVADIQMLHFLRMKKALTENDYPEVTLINMNGWAETTQRLWRTRC
ncbi:MAG TPA: DinB family protein [Flavipsychrobacter sp.]|nr:DinB family protein [Flavipsychrobacter sp.]